MWHGRIAGDSKAFTNVGTDKNCVVAVIVNSNCVVGTLIVFVLV